MPKQAPAPHSTAKTGQTAAFVRGFSRLSGESRLLILAKLKEFKAEQDAEDAQGASRRFARARS